MASNMFLNFTIAGIQNLPLPPVGKQHYFKDTQLKGLILDVRASGTKTFYVYKKIHGRPERIRLGTFPALSIENARKQAHIKLCTTPQKLDSLAGVVK